MTNLHQQSMNIYHGPRNITKGYTFNLLRRSWKSPWSQLAKFPIFFNKRLRSDVNRPDDSLRQNALDIKKFF